MQRMRTGLGLTTVALIIVLALTSTGAQATRGARIASTCSNETVNGGKYVEELTLRGELTLRFVLIGSVTCDEAHRLVRAYFGKMAADQQCGKLNSFCDLQFAGGWDCFIIPAAQSQDGAIAGCARTGAKIRLYKVKRGTSTPAGELAGVAATSARNAWAVGVTKTTQPLIAHWNGSRWRQVPSPRAGANSFLSAVAATSARNAWAVGRDSELTGGALILQWNGTAWKQVPSPSPLTAQLNAVAATSTRNAWAVGSNGLGRTLIMHWNGSAWTQVPSPNFGGFNSLAGVATVSASNVWAVGQTGSLSSPKSLILRWNGKAWKRVPSPSPGQGDWLDSVAVVSATDLWGGGEGNGVGTLMLRWNGKAWKRVRCPADDGSSIAVTSAGNAWAVGGAGYPIVHWNGTHWKMQTGPDVHIILNGVAATSARNAWAVGVEYPHGLASESTVILRWNGSSWK
jgi:hypothetical protein